ncbi:hypothetical protein AQUCO_01100033v1 [Aquilegia coerulea]|uniref:Uncharacterized protein n=1 Tax=Aquilegia coerulea TaxID=218851 RepID=A0A2G5E597_AQUCA|nr:hypothetical protein AQUCO_01100033v1 [Aquilegia coerulea]
MDQLLELHKADEKTILKLEDDIGSKCMEVEQVNEKLDKLWTSMEQMQSSIRRKDETIVVLNGEVQQANKKLEKLQSSMEQLQSSIGGKDETIVILKGEVEQTNMKVDKLVTSMQQLESSNTRKDEIIGKLKADLAKFEEETTKSKKEPSKLSEKVEILRKSEGASLMPVLNSYSGPLTRSMARQKRSMEIPTTSHALEGVSIAPVMISCTTKPCTQVRRPTRSQVRKPVSKTESLGSQVFDIEKTEMKKSITRKRKPDEDNSILKPRTRKKQCSS